MKPPRLSSSRKKWRKKLARSYRVWNDTLLARAVCSSDTMLMPARGGHRVLALLMGGELVALHNLQTRESVNCVRSDPPLLWRRCESVASVLALVVSFATLAIADGVVPLCMAVGALIALPLTASPRWGSHLRARRLVEAALFEAIDQARGPSNPRPIIGRVK